MPISVCQPCSFTYARIVTAVAITCLFAVGVFSAAVAGNDDDCLTCHSDPSLFEDMPNAERLVVSPGDLAGSVHGVMEFGCTDCHQDLEGFDDFPHDDRLEPVSCGACHSEEDAVFRSSLHGYALQRGNTRAPTCASCHGTHRILSSSDPRSLTHKVRLPATCAKCHGESGLTGDYFVKFPQSFTNYVESVHGKGVTRGIAAAASCEDCHSVHDLKSARDPQSPIYPANVSTTCGKCHPDIQLAYDGSIHGRAVQAGVPDSPTCTDCHGEHLILSSGDPGSKTYASKLATETCGNCHDDPVIIAKYSLREGVVGSYVDSYHGWASRRDHKQAATCVDCHTTHDIHPTGATASSTHPDNVVATCQTCHDNADLAFVASYTHESASISSNPINRLIRDIYIVLILFVIGGMVVHNLVIINYFIIERRKAEAAESWVVRFDWQEIVQHLLVTVSFTVLTVTGFALRYPDSWWVRYLLELGLSEGVRALLHRISGAVMVVTALYHMYYLFFTRRGRGQFQAMLPRLRDFGDLIGNLRFHLWRTRKSVSFNRFDYSQKAEYWALVWGTTLMILTGLVLWFPVIAVKILPSLVVPASQTLHFYEAWLAVLAIIVWHFFFVIFHPEQYPMSWTWLTGKMSVKSIKKYHQGWYQEEIGPQLAREAGGGHQSGSQSTEAPNTVESQGPL